MKKKPKKPLSMIELFNLAYKVKKASGKPKKHIEFWVPVGKVREFKRMILAITGKRI